MQFSYTRTTLVLPKPYFMPAFATTQEMYNYAANLMIVQKLAHPAVKNSLIHHGVTPAEADTVIQNLQAEIEKNKPAEASAKRAEGRKTMLLGLVLMAIGAAITGVTYSYGEGTYVVTYGLIAVGAWQFIKGLVKMA